MSARGSAIAPLLIPAFRRIWLGLLLFNLGYLILVVATSWIILELTGSPLWVSLMIGAPTLPMLLLALPAGAAADLIDRRRLLLASAGVMLIATAGQAAIWGAGLVSPTRLVSLGLLFGIGSAFFNPAWQTMVPTLVPIALVPGAISLTSALAGVATSVGPAVGGVLVAAAGPGWALTAATIGTLVIFLTVLTTPTTQWRPEVGTIGIAMATGLRYLRFSRAYLWLLLLGSLFGFSSAAVRAMLPNLTSDVLLGQAALYGGLLGALGAGGLIGGLTRAKGARLLGRRMLPVSIAGFGVSGMVTGASRSVLLTTLALWVAGVMWAWIVATLNSTFQVLTPDWVRGRAMSAFIVSIFGILPLGSITSGAIGDLIGAERSLLLFSAAVLVLGVAALRMPLPVLEHIQPPTMPEVGVADASAQPPARPVMITTTWRLDDDELPAFRAMLGDLRRVRLTTGAYEWAVYRSVRDPQLVREVYLVHSWEQHLQQQRRLDTDLTATLDRAQAFGRGGPAVIEELIALGTEASRRRRDRAAP